MSLRGDLRHMFINNERRRPCSPRSVMATSSSWRNGDCVAYAVGSSTATKRVTWLVRRMVSSCSSTWCVHQHHQKILKGLSHDMCSLWGTQPPRHVLRGDWAVPRLQPSLLGGVSSWRVRNYTSGSRKTPLLPRKPRKPGWKHRIAWSARRRALRGPTVIGVTVGPARRHANASRQPNRSTQVTVRKTFSNVKEKSNDSL